MKKNNKKYALKEMSKVKIIDRRSEKSIKGEREFLSKLHHPFIVNMACAFQDYENLYLVMDLLTGGDLRYHLCRLQKFSEDETKFFFACLILGLEYIHSNNIIHRDIKPENLVCEENGYIRITDFGVAKIMKEENSSETSGTPGYMAPEVLFAQNHSFPVDFFAIGVMGYEFMYGERPYIGKNRKEIKHLVFKKQAKIKFEDVPSGWSYESVDFINKCLKRKWTKRLGSTSGISELKNHTWFRHFNWEKLYNKNKKAPFIPKKGGNYDKKYCEAIEKISDTTRERYQKYRNQKNFRVLFEEYTYINYELISGVVETNTRVTTKTTITKNSKIQSPANHMNNNNYIEFNEEKIGLNNIKYNNNSFVKIVQNKKKEKEEENDDILFNKIHLAKSPQISSKKQLKLDNVDINFKLKMQKEEKKENKINVDPKIFSNNSIYNNINNIFNNIKKLASTATNKLKTNPRSSSVELSNTNLKNNLSHNLEHTKLRKKEINIKYTNNNNYKNINLNDLSNGSMSNSRRDKLSFKLFKSQSGLGESLIINNKGPYGKNISFVDLNSNNLKNLKKNNFIQLKKPLEGNKFQFYLPNLKKESVQLNLDTFKKKLKLNVESLKLTHKNSINFNNDNNNNFRTRNKFMLSPSNKKLKKSESTFFIKTPMNSSTYKLNHNSNINLNENEAYDNSNLFNTNFKKDFKKLSNSVFRKRKKSSKK